MDTVSSLIEIKLTQSTNAAAQTKTQVNAMQVWTQIYLKVEIDKSFPCSLKLTGVKDFASAEPPLVIKINMPGIEVCSVKSKTKKFIYGLNYKQNRKKCIAYLSFSSKMGMEANKKWMEYQIMNLESCRKEFLQKYKIYHFWQNGPKNFECDTPCPLSRLHKCDSENSLITRKRLSEISSIYEEITEYNTKSKTTTTYQINNEPPPLPPRLQRFDKRSYTSPESDYLKRKSMRINELSDEDKKQAQQYSFSTPDLHTFTKYSSDDDDDDDENAATTTLTATVSDNPSKDACDSVCKSSSKLDESESLYIPMNVGVKFNAKSNESENEMLYVPMTLNRATDRQSIRKSMHRYSIDEKIASYHPVYDLPKKGIKSAFSESKIKQVDSPSKMKKLDFSPLRFFKNLLYVKLSDV